MSAVALSQKILKGTDEDRKAYLDYLKAGESEYPIDVLKKAGVDMTNKDYEKYVISDAVHIGWKGWVYVDQQIAKHMNGKDPKNHKVDYSKNQPPNKDHKAHDHHEKKHHEE